MTAQHETPADVLALQVAVYMAAGRGFLGRGLAEQPGSGRIDSRVGRLPYGRRDIEEYRRLLVKAAERAGLDPNRLPNLPGNI